jgi:hypothetical protein
MRNIDADHIIDRIFSEHTRELLRECEDALVYYVQLQKRLLDLRLLLDRAIEERMG